MSTTASSAPIASALRSVSLSASGAIEKTVTRDSPPARSFSCSAASSAYSSYGLSTVSTPVRTSRFGLRIDALLGVWVGNELNRHHDLHVVIATSVGKRGW